MTQSNRKSLRRLPLAAALAAAFAGGAALELAAPPFQGALAQEGLVTPGFQAPSFADVVERARPAVVNISVTKVMGPMPTTGFREAWPREMPGSPLDEFFGRFFEMPGVPNAPRRSEGAGSGFIVDSDGYIVTNHHVISDAEKIVVTLSDGRQLDARVVGDDPQMDLALLAVDADEPLPFVEFGDSDAVRVGEWVLAIGNPFGLGGSASAGIVSARGRDIRSGPYDDYLQIDAPINRGNSGGPVFNAAGEVIGVSTAIVSPNGGSVGIGFAIPAETAKPIVEKLIAGEEILRGYLGVRIQPMNEDLAEALGLPANRGEFIQSVQPGEPAEQAGLLPGDVVVRVDGKEVTRDQTLSFLVANIAPGRRINVEVIRDGERRTIPVTVGRRPSEEELAAQLVDPESGVPQRPGEESQGTLPQSLGLQAVPLTPQIAAQLGVGSDTRGLVVTDIDPNSDAASKSITPGTIVLSANGRTVGSVADLERVIADAKAAGREAVLLRVRPRNGQPVSIPVRIR